MSGLLDATTDANGGIVGAGLFAGVALLLAAGCGDAFDPPPKFSGTQIEYSFANGDSQNLKRDTGLTEDSVHDGHDRWHFVIRDRISFGLADPEPGTYGEERADVAVWARFGPDRDFYYLPRNSDECGGHVEVTVDDANYGLLYGSFDARLCGEHDSARPSIEVEGNFATEVRKGSGI